jgi:hypothetical protein
LPADVTVMDLFGKQTSVGGSSYSKVAGFAPVYLIFNTTAASQVPKVTVKTRTAERLWTWRDTLNHASVSSRICNACPGVLIIRTNFRVEKPAVRISYPI